MTFTLYLFIFYNIKVRCHFFSSTQTLLSVYVTPNSLYTCKTKTCLFVFLTNTAWYECLFHPGCRNLREKDQKWVTKPSYL